MAGSGRKELDRMEPDRDVVDLQMFERYRARLFGIAYRMLGAVNPDKLRHVERGV